MTQNPKLPVVSEMAYHSIHYDGEELCGDRVQMVETEHSKILILADGMGHGVQANILSTLTSTMLATMFREGVPIDDFLDTILETLPIKPQYEMAYCTFTVLQVNDDQTAYLLEFDNPETIIIRDGEIYHLPREIRELAGKEIKEARFRVQPGDFYVMMSDGCLYCNDDFALDYTWNLDKLGAIVKRSARISPYAKRVAFEMVQACYEQYAYVAGDDTTAACMHISTPKTLRILTGPPVYAEDDEMVVQAFMETDHWDQDCYRIICGGTTANIVSRVLGRPIEEVEQKRIPEIPPYDEIRGIDLVTEGALTLKYMLDFLEPLRQGKMVDDDFFYDLDMDNGAALIATALLEDCTHLEILFGQAVNKAYEGDAFAELHQRKMLVERLKATAEALGKDVEIIYT